MGASTFSTFSSIFGLVVAATSLFVGLVNICRSHLPSNKIRELESLMDETETFFKKTVEDGLLIDPELVLKTARHLATLRKKTYDLQSRAYNATTFRQDCLELCRGTSKSIGGACQSLKKLKAKVAASSEKARAKLMERNAVPDYYFVIRAPDPVPVPRDWMRRDMAVPKGVRPVIPRKVIQTYEQLTHIIVYQLFIRLSLLEPGVQMLWIPRQ